MTIRTRALSLIFVLAVGCAQAAQHPRSGSPERISSNAAVEHPSAVAQTPKNCGAPPPVDRDLRRFAEWFAKTWNDHCFAELDVLVDESAGLYLLSNPGVNVEGYRYPNFSKLYAELGEEAGVDLDKVEFEALQPGGLPVIDCDAPPRDSMPDSFGPLPEKTNVLKSWYRDPVLFEDPEDARLANRLGERATSFVREDRAMVTFYFGYRATGWTLIAIDKVAPCSA